MYNERKKPSASSGNPEVRRMEEKKLTKMVTWLEVMTEGLSFGRSLKPEECALAGIINIKSFLSSPLNQISLSESNLKKQLSTIVFSMLEANGHFV